MTNYPYRRYNRYPYIRKQRRYWLRNNHDLWAWIMVAITIAAFVILDWTR